MVKFPAKPKPTIWPKKIVGRSCLIRVNLCFIILLTLNISCHPPSPCQTPSNFPWTVIISKPNIINNAQVSIYTIY